MFILTEIEAEKNKNEVDGVMWIGLETMGKCERKFYHGKLQFTRNKRPN
jgi:predicted metal-dependent TIM-barrel fold hydrolase